MRALLKVCVVVLAIVGSSCADDPPNVGATCAPPAIGCDNGLTCETAVTGGYCTKSCVTMGSRAECPEGAICDDISGTGILVCAKTCQDQKSCRADLECNGTSGSSVKICKVKI